MTAHVRTPFRPGVAYRRHLRVAAAAAVIPLVGFLAACGGGTGTASSSSTTPAPQAPTSAPDSGTPGGNGAFPGASGLIAAASPGTLQVQSATAQNTVVYSSSTTFTQVRPGHVAAGDCVTLTGTPTSGSASGMTATSARIEPKVNGACPTTGVGGGFGGFPGGGGGSPRVRPSGAPGSPPSAGSGARRAFASASGTVSSLSGSTILVKGTLRSGQGQARSATPASPTTITVTLPASATITQTVAATSSAAVVGQCARAIGTADSTGTITAKSITISAPSANGCNTGFGGRGNGNGAPGAANPGTNA